MSGQDIFEAIDARCQTTNNITALSIASSTTAGFLTIVIIPLNAVILFCLVKNQRSSKHSTLYYKLLLNIAISDLLTGLIAAPIVCIVTAREGARVPIDVIEVYIGHVTMFITDGVALTTMTALSIERIILLTKPVLHHNGMKRRNANLVVMAAWPVALVLTLPYLQLQFIKHLALFSTINVVFCIVSLLVTVGIYQYSKSTIAQKLLSEKTKKYHPNRESVNEIPKDAPTVKDATEELKTGNNIQLDITTNEMKQKKVSSGEMSPVVIMHKQINKATQAFIQLLCVFVLTYLPTSFTMLYMNLCADCNCVAIHVMRDVSILTIVSSSVFRPIIFIFTLKHLKVSVKTLCAYK